MATQELRKNCSNCGEPGLIKCPQCGINVYCRRECRSCDICKELELKKAIIRTADTIQKAYFAFREPLFDRSIVNIEERDHELVLHQGNAGGKKNGLFVDFPSHLIKDESMKEAVLCFRMGREPLAYLLDLIRYLTENLAVKVEEIQVRLKNMPRKTTVIDSNGVQQSIYPDNLHFLLRVTSTESNKTWGIDITGAQFGLTEQLWLWEEFLNLHIETVEVVSELSTSSALVTASSLVRGIPSVVLGIPLAAMDRINLAIKTWEETELDRRIFVLLHDENFPAAQTSLIKTIKETTRNFVDESDHVKYLQEAIEYEKQNPNASTEELKRLHSTLIISTHSQPVNKHCSSCGEPATMRCSQCGMHVYCNAKCQRAHWPKHKKACKTKNLDKIMHRAGALLQKMYLTLCKTTFKNEFTKIEDSGRHLTVHTKKYAVENNNFAPFPDHLITNKNDREMILCASRCANFVGHFKDVMEMMLKDSDVIVDEISIQMKPPDRSAILIIGGKVSSEGGHNSHYLCQITKERPFKQWIIDITGPQFNIFDPCLDLPTYTAKYIERYRLTAPLGTARILFEKLANMKGIAGLEARIDGDATRAIEKGIREWQTRSSSNLPELLRQPENIFKKQEQELLNAVQGSLAQFVASANRISENSSSKQYTIADLSSAWEESRAVFSQHEEYLAQFKD